LLKVEFKKSECRKQNLKSESKI